MCSSTHLYSIVYKGLWPMPVGIIIRPLNTTVPYILRPLNSLYMSAEQQKSTYIFGPDRPIRTPNRKYGFSEKSFIYVLDIPCILLYKLFPYGKSEIC